MYFSNLVNVHKYLLGINVNEGINKYFPNYYVEWIKNDENHDNLRIYQIENWWFWSTKKLIGAVDLVLKPENKILNIPFWFCNDENTCNKLFGGKEIFGKPIDYVTSNNIKKILFDYAEYFAKIKNCNILQRDVHNSLREFNDDIKHLGFKLNGQKASDNSAWLQSFKEI
jgi:hypothetical protein